MTHLASRDVGCGDSSTSNLAGKIVRVVDIFLVLVGVACGARMYAHRPCAISISLSVIDSKCQGLISMVIE